MDNLESYIKLDNDIKRLTVVDPLPTQNSTHLVSSGGVFEALAEKADFIDLGTYNSGTYPTDTDFVNAVASYIKSHFSNNTYVNIKYTRGGDWVGTMEYSPYQNGYISILAHYYQSGLAVHLGTTNGVPFYNIVSPIYKLLHSANTIIKHFTNGYCFIPWSELDNVVRGAETVFAFHVSNYIRKVIVVGGRFEDDGLDLGIVNGSDFTGDVELQIWAAMLR